MKVGVISDIHGNDIALRAVLADAVSIGVQHLLILGDVVGYYYNPDKVMEQIDSWAYDIIAGNHEQMMRRSISNEDFLKNVTDKYGSGIEIALQKLNASQLHKLCELPSHKTVIIDDLNFGLYHGSPRDTDEYIYPDTKLNLLNLLSDIDHDYVLMGHTHYPMCTHINNTTLINPGSVGQPRDIGGLASWAMVNTSNRMVVHRRIKFPIEELIKECEKYNPEHEYLKNVLMRDVNQ